MSEKSVIYFIGNGSGEALFDGRCASMECSPHELEVIQDMLDEWHEDDMPLDERGWDYGGTFEQLVDHIRNRTGLAVEADTPSGTHVVPLFA